MLKRLRILLLLSVLLLVVWAGYQNQRALSEWDHTKWVAIYPVNVTDSPRVEAYIATLVPADFHAIEEFMTRQAAHYGLPLQQPVHIKLMPELEQRPPQYPADGSFVQRVGWSLYLRWWAWQIKQQGVPADVMLFVQYYDPDEYPVLDHSLGVEKLALGLIKAFGTATMSGSNNVGITHELLHVFGATDKYHPQTNLPNYPDGYAEPTLQPRYPQRYAEIMGGRLPLSADKAVTPRHLEEVMIGQKTAREINWLAD